MIVQINTEETAWLQKQNNILLDIENNLSLYSDSEVQKHFDTFYNTVCSWQLKYPTQHLMMFWAIGANYDGFIAGNNHSFIGLYRELMDMVKDGDMTKPIRAVSNNQLIEIHEDGTKVVIDSNYEETATQTKKKG
ncbi:hypothetical protein SIM22_05955 [Bacillus cereus group sp. BfR-BA-01363]|uniref:hypothetical protein n=1 Tax=Bacillus cereus group sp. BfR-BA-01363 TaxID=3094882 RepID=UPI0029C11C8A|nr:hypothetical protein [Bacillus cereus group sp. BfR-BA-01363]MDX5853647.1 hypothetical protein [Bacillus cereus group sp. BfR-BA-01363]